MKSRVLGAINKGADKGKSGDPYKGEKKSEAQEGHDKMVEKRKGSFKPKTMKVVVEATGKHGVKTYKEEDITVDSFEAEQKAKSKSDGYRKKWKSQVSAKKSQMGY
jgi:hypothetical protein